MSIMVRLDFSEVAEAARIPKAMISTLVANQSDEKLIFGCSLP
jgi:hypothetical protein